MISSKEWRSKEQECAADTPSMNHSPSEEMYALEIASSRSVSTCTTLRRIPCLLALWNCEKQPESVAATQIRKDLRQLCYRSCWWDKSKPTFTTVTSSYASLSITTLQQQKTSHSMRNNKSVRNEEDKCATGASCGR
jgi:hypothetical protein